MNFTSIEAQLEQNIERLMKIKALKEQEALLLKELFPENSNEKVDIIDINLKTEIDPAITIAIDTVETIIKPILATKQDIPQKKSWVEIVKTETELLTESIVDNSKLSAEINLDSNPKQTDFYQEDFTFGVKYQVKCIKKIPGNTTYNVFNNKGDTITWTDNRGKQRDDFKSCSKSFTPFDPKICELCFRDYSIDPGYIYFPRE